MSAEVELPAVGKVQRKWVIAGGAVAVVIAAWWWMRRGDQAEAAAVAQEAQYANDAITGTIGASGYSNPNPGAVGYDSVDTGTNEIDTAPEWSNQVTGILSELGYEPGFVASTLGKYLSSQPLTAEEANLVQTAWAYAGKPPGGPSTFTLAGGGSTPGGGTPDPSPAPHDLPPRKPPAADPDTNPAPPRKTSTTYPARRT